MALLQENKKILEFLELVGRLKHVKRTGWILCDINECESIAGHMYRMGLMTFLLTDENNPTNLDRFRCLQIGKLYNGNRICGNILEKINNVLHRVQYKSNRGAEEQTVNTETVQPIPEKTQPANTTECKTYAQATQALVHDLAECIVGDITPHCGVTPEDKHRMEDEAMQKIAELTGMAGDRMYNLYKEYENQSSPEAKFAKDLDMYDMILQAFEYEKRENTPKKLQEFFTATEGKFNHPFIQGLVKELNKQREEFEKKTPVNGKV